MSALTKAILANALCRRYKFSKPDAMEMVEQFYEALRTTLENGEHVKLSGFGNFMLRDKSKRPGRNPKTKEDIPVQARRVVTFKPGVKLKMCVEQPDEE